MLTSAELELLPLLLLLLLLQMVVVTALEPVRLLNVPTCVGDSSLLLAGVVAIMLLEDVAAVLGDDARSQKESVRDTGRSKEEPRGGGREGGALRTTRDSAPPI